MSWRPLVALVVASSFEAAAAPQHQAAPIPETQQRLLGPMAADLLRRVGTFRVRAELRLTPQGRTVTIEATAVGRLVGGRWLVTEIKTDDEGAAMPRFEGLGVNGYDAEANRYVGYWVDGTRGIAVPVQGTFDPEGRVFRTSSSERRSDGSVITVTSETRRTGDESEVTTFWAPDENGRPYIRMVLTYTRL